MADKTIEELLALAKSKGQAVKILLTYDKPPFGNLLSVDIDKKYYKSFHKGLQDMIQECIWRISNGQPN